MAVAPTKNNDRFEWFLEKATEIGISEITPIICDHSERKVVKLDRFERIIESAMKQSLKMYKPKLNDAISFSDFMENIKDVQSEKYIAHCENSEKQLLKSVVNLNSKYTILIGPEGDFSETERKLIIDLKQTHSISLAKNILRAETAALSAITIVNYHLNLS